MRAVASLAFAFGIIGSLATNDPSQAQSWPQHPVRLIVPLPAGTAVDVSARIFAEHLSTQWRQPVIVENILGVDGVLATKEFVGRTDNNTLLYSFAGPITINPALYEKLPYDPNRDLVPIAMSSDNFLAIAASEKTRARSLADLVSLARSQPGKLNWSATAGLPYFAFAGFQKSSSIEMAYISYRDFNPAIADLGEGRIDVASTALTQLLPQHQAGKARLLAVINRTRSPAAPDVPTATEAGSGLRVDGVTGFFGWRDMSLDLRTRIAAEIRAIADRPDVKERFAALGIVARGSTLEEFATAIEQYFAKHPEAARLFNDGMTSRSGQENSAIVAAYDFSGCRSVIDLGGGVGTLLAAILGAMKSPRGVLFDLPHVIEAARAELAHAVPTSSCSFVAGSFFEALPEGGDVYVLKKVIHDWDDQRALSILRNCRAAMPSNGRVLLIEPLIPAGNGPSFNKLLDVLILLWTSGGKERTQDELQLMLDAADLSLTRAIPTASSLTIIEAIPKA